VPEDDDSIGVDTFSEIVEENRLRRLKAQKLRLEERLLRMRSFLASRDEQNRQATQLLQMKSENETKLELERINAQIKIAEEETKRFKIQQKTAVKLLKKSKESKEEIVQENKQEIAEVVEVEAKPAEQPSEPSKEDSIDIFQIFKLIQMPHGIPPCMK
jgi:hypothetical protein